jgi:hypothetical protein
MDRFSYGGGALAAWWSANLTAEATLEAARMQIEAQREAAKQEATKPLPPINVVVQMPEAPKQSEKK